VTLRLQAPRFPYRTNAGRAGLPRSARGTFQTRRSCLLMSVYGGHSGKHLLAAVISHFDPFKTVAIHPLVTVHVRDFRQVEHVVIQGWARATPGRPRRRR
jgi:hypothetical protein